MADTNLTEQQRTTIRMLDDYILDPDMLVKKCPLDHGRHYTSFLDIETLLSFRSVSMSGMNSVNSMIEYQKVANNASNSIRMAISIQTAHKFTIKDLFAKLCQRMCDGSGCDKFAPYLDVFTLTRRCLSVGGGYLYPRGPMLLESFLPPPDENIDPTPDQNALLSLSKFEAIKGRHSKYWSSIDTSDMGDCTTYYDFREVEASTRFGSIYGLDDFYSYRIDLGWKLCSVRAPWLNINGVEVEHGIFCELCEVPWNMHDEETPTSISESKLDWSDFGFGGGYLPDPMYILFMSTEKLKEHMEKHRSGQ
ncbi:predicted protein [Pyrenophora tritici-repentis Pt-1C-BFP]|uniref:Uncharacterized protein n=1 Tax=Pyrenophora tritici-repentis (strain Pt-1C-BFP) TaxID=426418 RepID=B2WI23_PYRTR|nr:uncharacterized protein PTRG_09632 [Pyrenophora tritici-repentis Pt-1C-BFP]EDU42683.1 predicted protein [Pyrenophora tritici-repentis Pt-1C-BFP]